MLVHALPGFLGKPKDWDGVLPQVIAHYLHHVEDRFSSWSKKFNERAKGVLMGYSLGGRLALHALIDDPSRWDAAVIVSANPGLKTEEEKRRRLENDEAWAKRFEEEPWEDLMRAWNAQPVFSGHSIPRQETDYSRKTLATILRNWSLGHQEDLREKIAKLNVPILWVMGEKDQHDVKLSHPRSRIWVCPNVGHRVPWEAKGAFQNELKKFLGDRL